MAPGVQFLLNIDFRQIVHSVLTEEADSGVGKPASIGRDVILDRDGNLKMRWMLVATLLLIPVSANALTGSTLLNHCKSGAGAGVSSAIPFGTCLGIVIGVMESMIANGQDDRFKSQAASADNLTVGYLAGWKACFPAKLNPGEARNAARKFLEKHPDKLEGMAVNAVAEALAGAYPCPQ